MCGMVNGLGKRKKEDTTVSAVLQTTIRPTNMGEKSSSSVNTANIPTRSVRRCTRKRVGPLLTSIAVHRKHNCIPVAFRVDIDELDSVIEL